LSTETGSRPAPTSLDITQGRATLSRSPYPFRVFRSFRGQIFFLSGCRVAIVAPIREARRYRFIPILLLTLNVFSACSAISAVKRISIYRGLDHEPRSSIRSSIIIPCWNQLEFTQQLAALKEHTRSAWELIVIDNGSNDGTAAYLAGVRDMASMPVTVVTNTTNLGFPAAINQGLQLARGDYLVLLNHDVVVTDG
jgi:cellulose synthase/poly-beta-1,6-N-acetylglucosamine synthase-like glycosyltransferase